MIALASLQTSFGLVRHAFVSECVTNKPQRTSVGRLRWWKPLLLYYTHLFAFVKGKTTLVDIKGKAKLLSLIWLRAVQRYIWADRKKLTHHKSTFDVQNIRPSPVLLWRLNLFGLFRPFYVWLNYPRLKSILLLTFESFLFICYDITFIARASSLCHALHSLDWRGRQSTSLYLYRGSQAVWGRSKVKILLCFSSILEQSCCQILLRDK